MSGQLDGREATWILLADDDDALREVLCMQLREFGYQVHEARDGEEALAQAREHLPALAIIDVMMPKLNGWEVARRLRADPETSSIKLLMLSGIGTEVLAATESVFACDLALDKPFETGQLEEALGRLLKVR